MPKTHLAYGPVYNKRVPCNGPISPVDGEDAIDWTSCMVFKCIYGCERTSIPYELLKYHLVEECP